MGKPTTATPNGEERRYQYSAKAEIERIQNIIQPKWVEKWNTMDEEIQAAVQELVDFFNEDMQLIPKTNVDECMSGVMQWVRVFNRDADALEEYHERWTKLAKLMAAQDKLPK